MCAGINYNHYFHDKFYKFDYADDGASIPGRVKSRMEVIHREKSFEIIRPDPVREEDQMLDHPQSYLDTIRPTVRQYDMAMLTTGAAVMAADSSRHSRDSSRLGLGVVQWIVKSYGGASRQRVSGFEKGWRYWSFSRCRDDS